MNIFLLDQYIKDYLVNVLLPREEVDFAQCKVYIPLFGLKSLIRLVEFPDGRGIALRLFPRRQRSLAHKLYLADDLLEKHNIAAPRIIDYEPSFSRAHLAVIAEEYIVGDHINQISLTDDMIQRIAQLVAALHRIKSPAWGDIEKPGRGRFAQALMRKVAHRLRGIRKHSLATLDRRYLKSVRKWFLRWQSAFAYFPLYDLIHDKLHQGNLIFSADRQNVFLLDFATLQFGYKAKDLAQLYAEILSDDRSLIQKFEHYYFASLKEHELAELRELYPFFHAYYHLSQCAINLKRHYKRKYKDLSFKSSFYNEFLFHWQELQDIIGEKAPNSTPHSTAPTG